MSELLKDSQLKFFIKSTVFFLALFLFAQTALTLREYSTMYMNAQLGEITVTGKGEVKAAPKSASFTFTVMQSGADKVAAQNDVAKRVSKVLSYLKESGVQEKNIKTLSFNVTPRYEWIEGKRQNAGYEARQTVRVKVEDKDAAGSVVSQVIDLGADSVSSLAFETEDEDMLKSQAREMAIKDAKEKADRLARQLGVKIVGVSRFSENSYGGPQPIYSARSYASKEDAVPVELPAGESSVTSNVNIVFKIR